MIREWYDLWKEGEYTYPMAFGFRPNLSGYLHEDRAKARPSIIVVPGGGYRVVSPTEGEIVAKKFYENGYQTFVCTYTVNITGAVPLKDQPAKDLARAARALPCESGLGGRKLRRAVYAGTSIWSCEDGEERTDSMCRGRKKAAFGGF